MEINLKDTLRRLRQKKNITQETLAAYLGITHQSVGKWERGEGFPDITMLPKIAIYFDVTVDELLDVGKSRIQEKIKQCQEESAKYKNAGENEKNLALWEEAYSEFPNECEVMSELMSAIYLKVLAEGFSSRETTDRIVSLGEQILQESNETQTREDAIQTLCYIHDWLGDEEKALYYAGKGGSFHSTREALFSFAQSGEEGVKITQQYILSLVSEAARKAAHRLAGKGDYTAEEKVCIYEFSIGLMKLLFPDDNVGFYGNYISEYYSYLARQYAATENAEKTLEALENTGKYAIIAAQERDGAYTAPMVNRLRKNPAGNVQNYKGNACNLRLKELERQEYDFVRGNERFLEVEKQLIKNKSFAGDHK
nr:helix-turn-helix transcriptional regulator [uncultured Acetatifactor sp.]